MAIILPLRLAPQPRRSTTADSIDRVAVSWTNLSIMIHAVPHCNRRGEHTALRNQFLREG